MLCIGSKQEFSSLFAGKNFGVGCKGGVEVVAHTLRDFVSNNTGKGLAALKIDFRNAFNCVDRSSFLSSVHRSFPGLFAWTEWCYGAPTVLLYNHSDVIVSSCGVQQGDPLGPFLFSLALAPIIDEIQALSPCVIVGPPDVLQKAWDVIRLKGPKLGLHPNPSKCEWVWLDHVRRSPCPLASGSVL